MSSSLESKRWLCFLHADLIYYFGSDEHCGNSTSLREPDTQWAFSRYLLNETMIHEQKIEKYWLSYGKPRVNIELWPFSSLQIHLFYHWFRFTHCRNIAYYFLNESEIFLFQNLPYTCWSIHLYPPTWHSSPSYFILLCMVLFKHKQRASPPNTPFSKLKRAPNNRKNGLLSCKRAG